MARIVIIGGGIMGSSIAYHLAVAGAAGDVTVIEPDPTYEFAATPRAVGGIRLQHAIPENVQMSLYGWEIYSDIARHVTGGAVTFDPGFYRLGYLYLVQGRDDIAALEATARMQSGLGVDVSMLTAAELRARWPQFTFAGADAGALTPDDGQIDPYAALMHYRRAAEGRGITYLKDRVADLERNGRLVSAVRLESGARIPCDTVVNVANCWAPHFCDMVGMPVPIVPIPRQTFRFDTQDPLPRIPAVRHANNLAFRRQQDSWIIGYMDYDSPGGFDWEMDHRIFEEQLWPQLAEQSPAFEAVKARGGWVGHYDMNRLDGNMILDRAPEAENFILAAGFSGHGLQHGPAVGRAVKEMILDGGFQTIDLSRFGYRRVVENTPLLDNGPKA